MLPEKFLDRMRQMLGAEYEAFLKAYDQENDRALRLNSLKTGMDGCSAAEKLVQKNSRMPERREMNPLRKQNGQNNVQQEPKTGKQDKIYGTGRSFAHLTKVPWAEHGYYFQPEDQPGKHPYHDGGLYYIQEPSAMVPAELLAVQPGERILDLCAAPGGKSTQIAAKLKGLGLLISNEINPVRAKILSENMERMGVCNACVTNETPERMADFFPAYFDRILVDAPCSGEGMFRKNEEACDEWSMENVVLCAERQDGILDCAAAMLRPGGRLVYSTCTFAAEENEGSIERFLQRHEDFVLLPVDRELFKETEVQVSQVGCRGEALRLWPHRVKGEGHFAAVLQKAGIWPEGQPVNEANGRAKGLSAKEVREVEGLEEFCRNSLCFPGASAESAQRRTGAESTKSTAGKEESPLQKRLGPALGMGEEAMCIRFGENLYLAPREMPSLKGMKVLRPGLHIGQVKKNRFEPSHALAMALPPRHAVHTWQLFSGDGRVCDYLKGGTFPAEGEKGWYLICLDGFGIGWGKLSGGIMKNHYPKGLRRN